MLATQNHFAEKFAYDEIDTDAYLAKSLDPIRNIEVEILSACVVHMQFTERLWTRSKFLQMTWNCSVSHCSNTVCLRKSDFHVVI